MFDHKITGPNAKKGSNLPPQAEGAADKMQPKVEGSGDSTPARLSYSEGKPGHTSGR